jgi:hypothetical protein
MAAKIIECRHIKTSGDKCCAPAIRGTNFCYFHSRLKRIKRDGRAKDAQLVFPDLVDDSAIQLALSEMATALANGRLNFQQAAVLLRTFRYASEHMRHGGLLASPCAVQSVCDSGDGEEIASDQP